MTLSVQYNFAGAVVLISGAASGIGAATARACAEHGARVVAIDVEATGLTALSKIAGIETHRIDVSDARAVDTLIADVHARLGRIDAAVLAAAVQSRIPTDELSDAEWRRHLAINLDGVFHVVRRLMPIMRAQRSGSMLAFTSGLVNMGWPGASAYAASKGALVGLMKCVAQELREFGVRANILSPGLLATPIFMNVASEDEVAMYERSLGVSSPEAVVPTVLYLISDAGKGMTGAVIERRLVPGEST
jgi:NAD(P)-dependent dehydrogenase (short-subunit alcohol dehydrogenase family)